MPIHRKKFSERVKEWRRELRSHRGLIILSLVFLVVGTALDLISGDFVTDVKTGVIAPDIILDHVPPINLEIIFVYGPIVIIFLLFMYPLFFHVKKVHVVLTQFSLLIMIRGFFMIFTHLKPPIDAIPVSYPWFLDYFNFQNDLFFSGHTAVPFLGFLVFNERIRYFFFAGAIILGATVLLMHIHYSIDVLSAFFITYGSYKIGEYFLLKLEKWMI
jgi:hypothetical protein